VTRRRLRPFPKLRPFGRFGGSPRFRLGNGPWMRAGRKVLRFLFTSQILTIFFGLCALGLFVGVQTRPAPGTFPWAEIFDQMQVVSYRDAPSDTTSRFVVQLCAGGRVFSQYDVERREFLPPPRGRSYARAITGTHYDPLRVRGHVGSGFWLDIPSRHSLLPEQYDEVYRRTLDFVKPFSRFTAVLGVLSGYSVGYRLGTWNGSLSSHAVQQRVLATSGLGRVIAREAWRRVLLEPVVMTGEQDVSRFVSIASTHRLYANFFRLALDDRDAFIPREISRLEGLNHLIEARAMRAFAAAVEHASQDTVHVTDADFEAIERWASLLDRRGHWIEGAIPPPGEERIKLMGALAWYGLAPPGQNVDRVWIGPRMLVRIGDTEGFVADEIPGTGAGCPISWRPRLREENDQATAMVSAWLADRPEFTALAVFGHRLAERVRQEETAPDRANAVTLQATPASGPDAAVAQRAPSIITERERRSYDFSLGTWTEATVHVVADDSARAQAIAHAAQSVIGKDSTAVDEAADTLRAHGAQDALIELPGMVRALGVSSDGEPWVAKLADPRGRMPVMARIRLSAGQAIASARHEGAQVIGVAVVAADARTAAQWSVTLAALDPAEAREKASQQSSIAAIIIEGGIDGPDIVWVESELQDRLAFPGPAQGLFRLSGF